MMRIVITGASGLLGWHVHSQLYAANCTAKFNNDLLPYDIVPVDRDTFNNKTALISAIKGAHAIIHFAGVNRGSDKDIALSNPNLAKRLIEACKGAEADPHIVYANSIHSLTETVYGQSKRIAGDLLKDFSSYFTNLLLPHIFGECAQPFYNNVTATLIHQLIEGDAVKLNPNGQVQLLHAGEVARIAIDAVKTKKNGDIKPNAFPISVENLFAKLETFHVSYHDNTYPNLSESIDLSLFNSYRAALYPNNWPQYLQLKTDSRGSLFEAVKGGGGGQTFISTTKPEVTRGDHFHLNKVERFLVVKGDAIIRIRKVLTSKVWEYRVSGDKPSPIDMPTLHTHSIENVGNSELITLFWAHELFDPDYPDTYADKVLP